MPVTWKNFLLSKTGLLQIALRGISPSGLLKTWTLFPLHFWYHSWVLIVLPKLLSALAAYSCTVDILSPFWRKKKLGIDLPVLFLSQYITTFCERQHSNHDLILYRVKSRGPTRIAWTSSSAPCYSFSEMSIKCCFKLELQNPIAPIPRDMLSMAKLLHWQNVAGSDPEGKGRAQGVKSSARNGFPLMLLLGYRRDHLLDQRNWTLRVQRYIR